MEIVVTLPLAVAASTGATCVTVPGWSVVGVAALLAAPRLVREYLSGRSGASEG